MISPKYLLIIFLVALFFNSPIDNLPQYLTSLTIRHDFSQRINLPPFLTYLKIGNSVNHPIDNLPLSLETLIIGTSFNSSIETIPPSLKHLWQRWIRQGESVSFDFFKWKMKVEKNIYYTQVVV